MEAAANACSLESNSEVFTSDFSSLIMVYSPIHRVDSTVFSCATGSELSIITSAYSKRLPLSCVCASPNQPALDAFRLGISGSERTMLGRLLERATWRKRRYQLLKPEESEQRVAGSVG